MKQTWVWNWVGGGYNTASASSRAEALKLARAKGAPSGVFKGLTVNEASLHVALPGEVDRLDKEYGSLFD